MKTSKLAALLTLSMALGMASPLFAADSTNTTAAVKTKPAKAAAPAHKVTATHNATSTSSVGEGGLGKAVEGSLVVTRVGGVGAALVIGIPVAIVRETYKSYTTWTPQLADQVGGHECGPSMALASLASVPASLVWGPISGTYHGSKNAFTKGFSEPFNTESFSMTKGYEE